MTAPAWHSIEKTSAYPADDANNYYPEVDPYEEIAPGERIVPLRTRSSGKGKLRGAILLLALGGGWYQLGDRMSWPSWLPTDIAGAMAVLDSKGLRPLETATAPVAATSPPVTMVATTKVSVLDAAPLPAIKTVETPAAPEKPAPPPPAAAAPAPVATAYVDPPVTPLKPAVADPADPYQVRALAAGLHPDLSRALLARLTPADYKNAGIAIKTALAETPDTAAYIWPREQKSDIARFQVHFVPGSNHECRRYIVTVAKDGWSTTALPMEKCGAEVGGKRKG